MAELITNLKGPTGAGSELTPSMIPWISLGYVSPPNAAANTWQRPDFSGARSNVSNCPWLHIALPSNPSNPQYISHFEITEPGVYDIGITFGFVNQAPAARRFRSRIRQVNPNGSPTNNYFSGLSLVDTTTANANGALTYQSTIRIYVGSGFSNASHWVFDGAISPDNPARFAIELSSSQANVTLNPQVSFHRLTDGGRGEKGEPGPPGITEGEVAHINASIEIINLNLNFLADRVRNLEQRVVGPGGPGMLL